MTQLPTVAVFGPDRKRLAWAVYDLAWCWWQNGQITDDEWHAYQWLWRTSAVRLSPVASEWQGRNIDTLPEPMRTIADELCQERGGRLP